MKSHEVTVWKATWAFVRRAPGTMDLLLGAGVDGTLFLALRAGSEP